MNGSNGGTEECDQRYDQMMSAISANKLTLKNIRIVPSGLPKAAIMIFQHCIFPKTVLKINPWFALRKQVETGE